MTTSTSLVVVITTVETMGDADKLSGELLQRGLAACVQIEKPIVSHYRWQDKLERAEEIRLMIKTSATAWPKLKDSLARLHPYEEPEIICLPVSDASDGYRDWVIDQTT